MGSGGKTTWQNIGEKVMTDDRHHPLAGTQDEGEGDKESFPLLNDYWEALARGEDTRPEAWLSSRPDAADLLRDLDIVAQLHEARLRVKEDSSFEELPTMDHPLDWPRPPHRPLLPPGTKLGNYSIESVLGRGGMGDVYLAEHEIMRQKFAVKVLADHLADSPGLRQRFRQEVQTLAALHHENIIAAKYADEVEGRLFLAMEYVVGINLHDHVTRNGPLEPLVACNYVLQAARGLEYAHRHGVVHRDIKPSNLLLTAEGAIKILDVGLARIVTQDAHAADASPTTAGALIGTFNYMAPEQVRDATQASERSDLYSLGCTFYWLLTAQAPFEACSPAEQLAATRVPIAQLRPEVPVRIAAVVEKLLGDKPEARYASARHLIHALEALVSPRAPSGKAPTIVRSELPDGGTVTVSVQHGATAPAKLTVSVSEQELTRRRRRRRMTIRVALTLAVVLVIIGFFQWPSTLKETQLRHPIGDALSLASEQRPRMTLAGSGSCSARACHGGLVPQDQAPQQNEHTTWITQDKHANAYLVLFNERSKQIARHVKNPAGQIVPAPENDRCLACHTNSLSLSDFDLSPALAEEARAGVGCESCHGGAKEWLEAHTSPKWKLLSAEEKRARGMTPTWDILGYATRCAGCHVGGTAAKELPLRDVNHDLIAAGHPRLQFELTAYLANLPRHWSVATEKKKPASFEAEAWVLGQLASARVSLELLESRARTATAPWPEFAEYDCSACHHDLHQPSWQQTKDHYHGRLPGALPWSSWYYAVPTLLAGQGVDTEPVLDHLKSLAGMMQKPMSDRRAVADQAAATAKLITTWKARTFDVRDIKRFLTPARWNQVLQTWDGTEQVYLALSAFATDNAKLQAGLAAVRQDWALATLAQRQALATRLGALLQEPAK
jgi:serine/threonine protein kinase